MKDPNEVLSLNGALMQEIDRHVTYSAAAFSNGSPGSMNSALDYTALSILESVRHHLGLPPLVSYQPPA